MSVATKNMFALLDDEEGPKAPAAPAAKAAPAAGAAGQNKPSDNKRGGGPAARSGRYPGRGGGQRSGPRTDEVVNPDASEAPKRFEGEKARRGGGRGRGEGRGEGRGGGEGRGRGRGGRGGGREGRPDRHSATGLVDSDKKLHQGWGGDTGDSERLVEAQGEADAQAATNDWAGDAPAADASGWDASAGGAAEAGEGAAAGGTGEGGPEGRRRRPREDEEEDNTLTLDEFQKSRTTGLEELVPKLAVRTINEGAEEAFKGATKLTKDEEEHNYFVGKGKSGPRPRAQKEAKQIIEIDARFERPSRGVERGSFRGGRGRGEGRGGGGEGRGRGGFRGGPPRGAAPRSSAPTAVDVDDAKAFPSLS